MPQQYRVEFDDDDGRWCVWGDDFVQEFEDKLSAEFLAASLNGDKRAMTQLRAEAAALRRCEDPDSL